MADAGETSEPWAAPGSAPAPKKAAPVAQPAVPMTQPPVPAPATPAPATPTTFTPGPVPAAPAIPPPPPPAGYAAPGTNPPPPPPPPAGYAAPGVHTAPLTYRSWQPGIVALRPLTFGDFFSVPFRAFRFSRAVVVGGPTVMTLVSAAATTIAGWLFFTDPLLGISDFNPQWSGIQVTTVIAIVVAVLSWFAADMLASGIVVIGISRAVLGEKIGFGAAWKQLVPRIPQLMLLYLMTGALVVLLLMVASIPMLAGIASEAIPVVLLGYFLMIVVMLGAAGVIGVYLPAVRGAVVMERVKVTDGIRRSLSLMKRRFWWTFLIVFVTSLTVGVLSNVLQTAGQFVGAFGGLIAPDNPAAYGISFGVGYGLALVLSSIITYAFLGSVNGLIYIDARMRREGFDVELARAAEARHRPANVVVG